MAGILGLYIHIPFCRSKCDYCDFYSLAGREEQMDLYQKALLAQFKRWAPLVKGRAVDTIYFGGGTPSYYGAKRIRELLLYLQRRFPVSRQAEITLECNPDSVDARSMSALRRAGVNRVSLGMQSADAEQLRCIHRIHTPRQAELAVAELRRAKIDNISLDLIYGLPGQSLESWQQTLRSALALEPEHISCYGLKTEPGTPLARQVEAGLCLPDEDAQADFYLKAVELLQRAGFRQYEISNFAKTGRESRHNLKYWMGREYLGFGPGAHSYFGGKRFSYPRDLDRYLRSARRGEVERTELQEIDGPERAREYLMLRMRTLRGIEEWEYRRKFGLNFEPISRRLEFFEAHHWAELSGKRWHFTPQGFLLSNTLILELLEAQSPTLGEQQILRRFQDPNDAD